MKIAVVGTGYVGLVTGTCLSETGNNVICIDINEEKVAKLKNGIVPIYEPGLESLFHRNIAQHRLKFTQNLEEGIEEAEVIFLALPTPPGADGSADLKYILGAAADLGKIIKSYKVIVDKSTVPVGTANKVREAMAQHAQVEFDVVSNPEFLREGVAVEDFMKPDRIVIGSSSERARKIMGELYAPYVRQGNPILYMDENSAELTKYAANSFLATKISFMNEIANLCELLDANVDMVRRGIGADDRIGKRFLFPGVGYGGSCFPKDVQALSYSAQEHHYDFRILDAVMDVNEIQKNNFIQKIKNYFGDKISQTHFALWGLAFKPETDDIREAPALYIIEKLLEVGAKITVYDPEAIPNVKAIYGDKIEYAEDEYHCLSHKDALIIVTEWSLFRTPDWKLVKSNLNNDVIFDGRNLYDLEKMQELGFYYQSIGRKLIDPKSK